MSGDVIGPVGTRLPDMHPAPPLYRRSMPEFGCTCEGAICERRA